MPFGRNSRHCLQVLCAPASHGRRARRPSDDGALRNRFGRHSRHRARSHRHGRLGRAHGRGLRRRADLDLSRRADARLRRIGHDRTLHSPIACALGLDAAVTGSGRLPERPLSPLYEELQAHGIDLSPQGVFPLHARGRLPAATTALRPTSPRSSSAVFSSRSRSSPAKARSRSRAASSRPPTST